MEQHLHQFGSRFFGDGVDPMHVAEEMDDVIRPGQQRQVALDDDAVETNGRQKLAGCRTACGKFPSVLLGALAFDNKIIEQRADGSRAYR